MVKVLLDDPPAHSRPRLRLEQDPQRLHHARLARVVLTQQHGQGRTQGDPPLQAPEAAHNQCSNEHDPVIGHGRTIVTHNPTTSR
jgi:hypothetical protein